MGGVAGAGAPASTALPMPFAVSLGIATLMAGAVNFWVPLLRAAAALRCGIASSIRDCRVRGGASAGATGACSDADAIMVAPLSSAQWSGEGISTAGMTSMPANSNKVDNGARL